MGNVNPQRSPELRLKRLVPAYFLVSAYFLALPATFGPATRPHFTDLRARLQALLLATSEKRKRETYGQECAGSGDQHTARSASHFRYNT